MNDVRRGIGHDSRIGFMFMYPGVGYGGSCFPKDVRALVRMFEDAGIEPDLLSAVDAVNERQKRILLPAIEEHFGGQLRGRKIAVWGLSFKPRTDDVREAPALVMIDRLLKRQAELTVHDPEALENVRRAYGDRLRYVEQPMPALDGAEALLINTEWFEFRHPDFKEMKRRMASPVIFDGRNLYDPDQMRQAGFTYHSIGRRSVISS